MKPQAWWVLLMVLVVGYGCQEVGECWPISEDGQGAGVGGGPIVPGSGGYGNVPPKPQSTTSPPPADCLIVPATACHQKCLDDYENTAVKCAKIQDEAQRKACDAAAHATYTKCREGCERAEAEKECKKCKLECDAEHDKCHAKCNTASCHAECNEAYGKCLKECGDCPH